MLKLGHCLTRCSTAWQDCRASSQKCYQRIEADTLKKIPGELKPEPLLNALAGALGDIKANNVFHDSR